MIQAGNSRHDGPFLTLEDGPLWSVFVAMKEKHS